MRTPLYKTLHQVPKVSTMEGRGSTVFRTLHQVPKVSAIEEFHCIQDTSPGPQDVHNRGVPLHICCQNDVYPVSHYKARILHIPGDLYGCVFPEVAMN